MKRRSQTGLNQQQQRRAGVLQPIQQRSTGGAAVGRTQGARASGSDNTAQSIELLVSIPGQSALERVGPDVLVLILQYLTARHRLSAVWRLSRAFRSLPAVAFSLRDFRSALLPDITVTGSRERGSTGQLRSLSLTVAGQDEWAARSTVFSCPRSLVSMHQTSALEALVIHVEPPSTADVRCVLRSVLCLPSLQRLHVSSCFIWGFGAVEADWTDRALPSNVALRHLKLEGLSLSAASLLRLFSLPLESLDLEACAVLEGRDSAAVSAEPAAGSSSISTLRSLSLPEDDGRQVLQLYGRATQRGGSQLEQLACSGLLRHALLSLIASHGQQLRELNLNSCKVRLRSRRPPFFSPLLTAAGAPCLPQLTTLGLPQYDTATDSDDSFSLDMENAFSAASRQLVAAYSAQLTALFFPVEDRFALHDWLWLVFRRCHHLVDLSILWTGRKNPSADVNLESETEGEVLTLPRLKRLRIDTVPVNDGGLLAPLSRCPELERCPMDWMPQATEAGKEAARRCCPKLRRGARRDASGPASEEEKKEA